MSQKLALFIVAGLMLGMIPIAPKILALRIRVHRFLHLGGLADWHERHCRVLLVIARLLLVAVALVLAGIGLGQ